MEQDIIMESELKKLEKFGKYAKPEEYNKKIYKIYDILLDDYLTKKSSKPQFFKMCKELLKYLKLDKNDDSKTHEELSNIKENKSTKSDAPML